MSLEDNVISLVKQGGVKVKEEEFEKRLKICQGCDYKGKVKPIPKPGGQRKEYDGCKICGCPFDTKLRFKYHILNGVKLITCPHPEGAKW